MRFVVKRLHEFMYVNTQTLKKERSTLVGYKRVRRLESTYYRNGETLDCGTDNVYTSIRIFHTYRGVNCQLS